MLDKLLAVTDIQCHLSTLTALCSIDVESNNNYYNN